MEIKAEFPWGSETVETVCYSGTKLFENIDSTERELFEVYQLYLSKHPLTFELPTFSCANECKNLPLKINFIYLGKRKFTAFFMTCCTIHVLSATNAVYFISLSLSVPIIHFS